MNAVTSEHHEQRQQSQGGMTRRATLIVVCLTVAAIGVSVLFYVRPFSLTSGSTTINFGPVDDTETGEDIDVNGAVSGWLADELGVGELTPMCDDLPDLELGVTFTCTATTTDGRVIEIAGGVEARGTYIEATNAVLAQAVEEEFVEGYSSRYPEDGLVLEHVDCGEGYVVLVEDQLDCTIDGWRWDPSTVTITILALEPLQFHWIIN